MKKLIFLILAGLVISSTLFSQSIISSNNIDSLLCFSKNKSRFLLMQAYELEKCRAKLSLADQKLSLKDTLLSKKNATITNYGKLLVNKNEELWLASEELNEVNLRLESQIKATRRQRLYKWLVVAGSAAIIVSEAYFLGIKN